jgi:lysyl-tRNA synthetase class 1
MLLTLVSSSNAENAETLWVSSSATPGRHAQPHPKLDALVGYAIHYFATSCGRPRHSASQARPNARRCSTCATPCHNLAEASAEQIQEVVYEIGRREPFLDEKKKPRTASPVSLDWFNMLYQVLLGQEKGPRFGSFAAVYGSATPSP